MIAGLLSATCNSYTPRPKVELLKFVYDVKLWLNPHIEDLYGHTQPHCFKFVLKGVQEIIIKLFLIFYGFIDAYLTTKNSNCLVWLHLIRGV